MCWPEELLHLFERALTVEYASLTRAGAPVTYPLTPYVGQGGTTLDVSTGLTYPAKAERARRNPKVASCTPTPWARGLRRRRWRSCRGSRRCGTQTCRPTPTATCA
jgi:hypothetical protein